MQADGFHGDGTCLASPTRDDSATGRSQRAFLAVWALIFAVTTAVTVLWCGAMTAMEGMAMPGGWTMSMAWMRMPGQSWLGAAANFLGMWIVMMPAMKLPTLLPRLLHYRAAIAGAARGRLGCQTLLVGLGYFLIWGLAGLAVYPLGLALAAAAMRQPALAEAAPIAFALVPLLGGLLQFTAWKARQLACCRTNPEAGSLGADRATAWRHGLKLGLHCLRCCSGLMAILLVAGVMDLRAMALVAAAIALERLAPDGRRAADAIGGLAVGAGLLLLAQATGLA